MTNVQGNAIGNGYGTMTGDHFDVSGATAGGTTPPTITKQVAYLGQSGISIALPSGAGVFGDSNAKINSAPIVNGHTYVNRFAVVLSRALTGGEAVSVIVDGDRHISTITFNSAFSPAVWTYVSAAGTAAGSGTLDQLQIYASGTLGSAITIYVRQIQLEDVTGQSNQNPSEYVSVGVLSAPYHGVGVDGVQYFNTLNGNTVSSNVVTQATGAAIKTGTAGVAATAPVDANGPYGYQADGARAELLGTTAAIRRTMSSTYVLGATMTLGTDTGADGTASSAAKLTGGATAATNTILLTTVEGAGAYTYTLWCKRDFGSAAVNMTVNGGTNYTAMALTAAYQQFILTDAASANPIVGIQVTGSGDVVTCDFSGLRAGSFYGSTPIPINVSQAADVLTYPSAGNISGTVGTAYAEFTTAQTGTAAERAVLSNGTPNNIYIETLTGAGTPLGLNDGTANRSFGLNTNVPITSPVKAATVWSGSATNGFLSGAAGTPAGFDGDMNIGATIIVGDSGSGNRTLFGTIRNVRIWPVALPAWRLINLTTASDATDWLSDPMWRMAANDEQYRRTGTW